MKIPFCFMIFMYKLPTLSFFVAISHVTSDPVFVVQGLAELKELAGVDKDVDEDEDLGLLEQEASMPLHELLAKMKEVCKRFKFCQRGNTACSLCGSASN